MKIAIVAVIMFLVEAQPAAPSFAQTQPTYGAIAYSWSSGGCGNSANLSTRPDAERSAVSNCGRSDCEVVLWFRGGCAALAEGQGRKIGWAQAGSKDSAEKAAQASCYKNGGADCRVLCSVCTR
jgi:Domain of unknown function (DUF4189)